jgi:aspartyl-tRNA(Asn)/glutamyl-tRNA(Gln) amidotransferase subunit A
VALGTGFSADGMPTGMQIAGPAFADARVLRVAHAYQQATEWHRRLPAMAA